MEFLRVLTFVLIPSEETKSTARLSGQGQGVTPLIELFLIFWFLVQQCLSSKGVFRELLIWYRISFSSLVCRLLNLSSQEPEFLGTSAHIVSRSFLSESLSCYANLTQGIILIIIWRQIPTKETLLPNDSGVTWQESEFRRNDVVTGQRSMSPRELCFDAHCLLPASLNPPSSF